jgi:carboxylesterase
MDFPPIAGTEPFTFVGGEVGVLLVHGFTGSPQGLRPWGEALRDGGLTVHCPCLPGHGTHHRDLARVRWPAWVEAVERGLQEVSRRCARVVIGALSFGGALAMHLAASHPEVRGVVTVNPFLYSTDRRMALLPVLKHLLGSVPGVGSDIADRELTELAYDRVPLKTYHSLHVFQKMVRAELPRVTQPLRVYVSRQDHVVNPGNATYLAEHVGSRDVEVIWLERSYHVATLDADRHAIFAGSLEFIRRVTAA